VAADQEKCYQRGSFKIRPMLKERDISSQASKGALVKNDRQKERRSGKRKTRKKKGKKRKVDASRKAVGAKPVGDLGSVLKK